MNSDSQSRQLAAEDLRTLMAKVTTHHQLTENSPTPALLVKPRTMLQLAQNPFERTAALFLLRIGVDIPPGLVSSTHRAFAFRCHLVPLYSRVVIECFARKEGPQYWLHEHGTYFLAWERMGLEFALRNKLKTTRQNLLDLILESPQGPAYWQKRFEEWRIAAERSFAHFMGKKFPDTKKLIGRERTAAQLGALKKLSQELPDDVFAETRSKLESDTLLLGVFMRNAGRKRLGRWGDPELDTWLLEIWPLVTEYGWNYYQLWQVANNKWESPSDDDAVASVTKLEERCKKMLKLRLGCAGKSKSGRPLTIAEGGKATLPSMASLAIGLESLGFAEEEWILGQAISEE